MKIGNFESGDKVNFRVNEKAILDAVNLRDYVKADKKFCEGVCDRQQIGNLLVCHGCKRILIKNQFIVKVLAREIMEIIDEKIKIKNV